MKIRHLFLMIGFTAITSCAFAQKKDSTLFFRSALSVTHNGFSFVPAFSLGKPAAVLDLAVGNKRLSFEPQFRFALEGKPWSFIFIYRYKFIKKEKFQFAIGGHLPAFNWRTETVIVNNTPKEIIATKRFLAGELLPHYQLTKNISLDMYILIGHGWEKDVTRNTRFVGLKSNFSNIKLSEKFYAQFVPQVFYLSTDNVDGIYVTYSLTLAARNFPLSLSHIINQAIASELTSKHFDWNVSLVYSFSTNYVRK
jgi:hypothetical protein